MILNVHEGNLQPIPEEKVNRLPATMLPEDIHEVKEYVKSLIDTNFIQPQNTKWFSVSDLIGPKSDIKAEWEGTPLQKVVDNRKESEDPMSKAAQDIGWFVKQVLNESPNYFERRRKKRRSFSINQYRLISPEIKFESEELTKADV